MSFPTSQVFFNPNFGFATESLFVQVSPNYQPTNTPANGFLLLESPTSSFLLLEAPTSDLLLLQTS